MHRSIYEFLLNGSLRYLLYFGASREDLPDIEWLEIPNEKIQRPLAAVDGSYKSAVRDFGLIYAITGLTLYQDGNVLKDRGISFVDVMEKNIFRQKHLSDFLSMFMKLAEFKNTLNILKNSDTNYVVLMDGSFISDVITPQPTYEWISHLGTEIEEIESYDEIISELSEEIDERFWKSNFAFVDLVESLPNKSLPLRAYATLKFLYYEYLLSITKLVELKNPIFFIAKDSFSSDFVKAWEITEFLTDQVMFNICTINRAGYAPPIPAMLEEKKKYLPQKFIGILDTEVYQTFVRFKPFSVSTYKVEVLNVPREEIGFYISYIAEISPRGYPFLLESAHRYVVITERDMDKLAEKIYPFGRSPRAYLNE